jgi:hypothetical protein
MGSKPSVEDVLRMVMPDGCVVEKSRPALGPGAARTRVFPPGMQASCEAVCAPAGAPGGPARGYALVSYTGEGRAVPCCGRPEVVERLQRVTVRVSGASLVADFSEGGGATVSVEAERGSSRSSVRRALVPAAWLLPGLLPGLSAEATGQPAPAAGAAAPGGAEAAPAGAKAGRRGKAAARGPSRGGGGASVRAAAPRRPAAPGARRGAGRRTSELPPPD